MIALQELIESVKKELVEYQKKHRGEPSLFQLKQVEMEAAVTVKSGNDGKATIAVAELKLTSEEERVHKVKLVFDLPRDDDDGASEIPLLSEGETFGVGLEEIREKIRSKFPAKPVRPFGPDFVPPKEFPGGFPIE